MSGSLKVILWTMVIGVSYFDPAVLVAEASGSGSGFEIIIGRVEYLVDRTVKQHQDIAKLNQHITESLDEKLSKLELNFERHLKNMEARFVERIDSMIKGVKDQLEKSVEGNSERFENVKSGMDKQYEQIANLVVQSRNTQQTILDDKFDQQNQVFQQRVDQLEEIIGKRFDKLTEECKYEIRNSSDVMLHNQSQLDNLTQEDVSPQLMQPSKLDSAHRASTVNNQPICNNTYTKLPRFTSPVMRSCSDARITSSGLYRIQPFEYEDPFEAYCEQEKFDGGWHVIQHRFDGSVDFYRGWDDYKTGFGDLDGEFFAGLQIVHQLTTARKHLLMVEVESFDGKYGYERYDSFEIGSEDEQFQLKELGKYSGTARNSLRYSKGMKFSTKDRDNDEWPNASCALDEQGAWWYRSCARSNLNGPYVQKTSRRSNYWFSFRDKTEGLKVTRMMIKEAEDYSE